jgi:hypothetical protein
MTAHFLFDDLARRISLDKILQAGAENEKSSFRQTERY